MVSHRRLPLMAAFTVLALAACESDAPRSSLTGLDAAGPSPLAVGDPAPSTAPGSGPRTDLGIHATNLSTSIGDPGQVGDRLAVDVTGSGLRALQGRARFRPAAGGMLDLEITNSNQIGDELALYDNVRCPSGQSEVITIQLDGFQQGVTRVFVHECDGTTLSVFDAALDGAPVDRVRLMIQTH